MSIRIGGSLFFALGVMFASVAAAQETLGVTVVKASLPAHIELSVTNLSERPLRIWQEGTSWGAAHWRVLIFRAGHVDVFFQNPDGQFTSNAPIFTEIKPHAHISHTLDLSQEGWRGPNPKGVRTRPGDVIVVIYDVPKIYATGDEMSRYASTAGVWFGVAAATTTIR